MEREAGRTKLVRPQMECEDEWPTSNNHRITTGRRRVSRRHPPRMRSSGLPSPTSRRRATSSRHRPSLPPSRTASMRAPSYRPFLKESGRHCTGAGAGSPNAPRHVGDPFQVLSFTFGVPATCRVSRKSWWPASLPSPRRSCMFWFSGRLPHPLRIEGRRQGHPPRNLHRSKRQSGRPRSSKNAVRGHAIRLGRLPRRRRRLRQNLRSRASRTPDKRNRLWRPGLFPAPNRFLSN